MFNIAKTQFRGEVPARELDPLERKKTVRMVGDFVCDKHVQTTNGKLMKFGTFLDVHADFLNTVLYPLSLKNYPLNGIGLYLIQSKVVIDFGCPAIEIHRIARLPLYPDPRSL